MSSSPQHFTLKVKPDSIACTCMSYTSCKIETQPASGYHAKASCQLMIGCWPYSTCTTQRSRAGAACTLTLLLPWPLLWAVDGWVLLLCKYCPLDSFVLRTWLLRPNSVALTKYLTVNAVGKLQRAGLQRQITCLYSTPVHLAVIIHSRGYRPAAHNLCMSWGRRSAAKDATIGLTWWTHLSWLQTQQTWTTLQTWLHLS